MNEKEINRILAANQKRLNKEHQKKFNKVCRKIWKLRLKNKYANILIDDLEHANGDLMDVLTIGRKFVNLDDYIATIQAYLNSETTCYDYANIKLEYKAGTMEQLMEIIRLRHNYLDLREKIGLDV